MTTIHLWEQARQILDNWHLIVIEREKERESMWEHVKAHFMVEEETTREKHTFGWVSVTQQQNITCPGCVCHRIPLLSFDSFPLRLMELRCFSAFLALQVLCVIDAYPSGAPTGACEDMMPRHSGMLPQPSPAPYSVLTNANTYQPGNPITGKKSRRRYVCGFMD